VEKVALCGDRVISTEIPTRKTLGDRGEARVLQIAGAAMGKRLRRSSGITSGIVLISLTAPLQTLWSSFQITRPNTHNSIWEARLWRCTPENAGISTSARSAL